MICCRDNYWNKVVKRKLLLFLLLTNHWVQVIYVERKGAVWNALVEHACENKGMVVLQLFSRFCYYRFSVQFSK